MVLFGFHAYGQYILVVVLLVSVYKEEVRILQLLPAGE